MKDNVTPLYTSPQLGARVSTYSEQHSTPLPKYISDYHAHISSTRDDSEYLSSGFQSQFNIFLAKSIGAKRGEYQSLPSKIFAKLLNGPLNSPRDWCLCRLLCPCLGSCRWSRRPGNWLGVRAQVRQALQRGIRSQRRQQR